MKNNTYDKYKSVVILSTILTIFFSLIYDVSIEYRGITLIPLIYLVFFILNKPLHQYSRTKRGLLLLNVLMYIKYVMAILVIIITKDYKVPSFYAEVPNSSSYMMAIIYIIIELIAINFTILFFSKHFYKEIEDNSENICNYKKIRVNIIIMMFIGICIFLAVLYPNYFKPEKILLFDNAFEEQKQDSNIIHVISLTFKTVLMGLFVNRFIIKYQKTGQKKYIAKSYLAILIYILFNTSSSRINMVLPIIIFIIITDKIFKRNGRLLFVGVIIILATSITAITINKFIYKYNKNSSFIYVMTESLKEIQEYTSNIRPTAIGLDSIEYYKKQIGIKTFANDILGSVPIVSHYIDQNNRINQYYNLYVLNGRNTSQIVPMIVSSIAYFSPAFPVTFTIFFIIILLYIESNFLKKEYTNFLQMYMNLFLIFQIAFCCINGNVQMLIGKITVRYLPVILIMKLNEIIIFKKKHAENTLTYLNEKT